jgi:hypothetical protein
MAVVIKRSQDNNPQAVSHLLGFARSERYANLWGDHMIFFLHFKKEWGWCLILWPPHGWLDGSISQVISGQQMIKGTEMKRTYYSWGLLYVQPCICRSACLLPLCIYAEWEIRHLASPIRSDSSNQALTCHTWDLNLVLFITSLFFFQKTKIWPFFLSFEASGVSTTTHHQDRVRKISNFNSWVTVRCLFFDSLYTLFFFLLEHPTTG